MDFILFLLRVKILIFFFCFGYISTNERPDASFQVPHYFTLYMMNILVVNIPARVSLSSLDSCSEKAEIVRHSSKEIYCQDVHIFSNPIAFIPYHRRYFSSFAIYFLFVKKSIFNETTYKSVSTNLPIKFLPEVCLEVLPIEFDM